MIMRDLFRFLDDDLLDDFVIAHHPTLLREIESAREEYVREGGVSHAEMRKRLQERNEQ